MAQIGPLELVLIVLILVLVFRPKTITDIARNLGNLVNEYRKAARGDEDVLKAANILGIDTQGKDLETVKEEIRRRLKSSP
jgi:Sec-independent protein translocase protein TatA